MVFERSWRVRTLTYVPYALVGMLLAPGAARAQVLSLPCTDVDDGFEIRGTVADLLSGAPMPGSLVTLLIPDTNPLRVLSVTEAGGDGEYVFCARSAPDPAWAVVAELDTLQSRTLSVPPAGPVEPLYLEWSQPATLSGRVRHFDDGRPVEGARVTVEGRSVRASTDGTGAFRLRGLGAGSVVIATTSLGLLERTDTVFLPSGATVSVDISMSAEPIALPALTVSVGAPPVPGGVSFFGLTESRLDELRPRAIDFAMLMDLSNTPGLQAHYDTGARRTCVQFLRRANVGCSMVAVFVNGAPLMDAGEYLASLPLESIKEIRVYRPIEARFRFGIERARNGAIDIILR